MKTPRSKSTLESRGSGAPEGLPPACNLFTCRALHSIQIRKAIVLGGLEHHFQIFENEWDEGQWCRTS